MGKKDNEPFICSEDQHEPVIPATEECNLPGCDAEHPVRGAQGGD